MSFKVLYSEVQPCVLLSCDCRSGEPFLLMIRTMGQTVRCGFCSNEYAIEAAQYVARDSGNGEPSSNGLKIKCTSPPTPNEEDRAARH